MSLRLIFLTGEETLLGRFGDDVVDGVNEVFYVVDLADLHLHFPGSFVKQGADGDLFRGTLEGDFTDDFTGSTGTFDLTGGTGRFVHLTGDGAFANVWTDPAFLSGHVTVDGHATFDASDRRQ